MANEYFVNAADLKAVADAIRTKGETTESLAFPDGFVSAIEQLSTSVKVPEFTYNGTYNVLDDGDDNWRVKFLSSGTFIPSTDMTVDVCLVGAGGGGGQGGLFGNGGGGGGYVTNQTKLALTKGTSYTITIGAGGAANTAGGTTSAFNLSATGGSGGASGSRNGAKGGSGGGAGNASTSGGAGGSNGSDGTTTASDCIGGSGSLKSTYAFGDTSGELYAGGGGGGTNGSSATAGAGGDGGGGRGAKTSTAGLPGDPNTGGGGGGGNYGTAAGSGGSGLVVIRNAR